MPPPTVLVLLPEKVELTIDAISPWLIIPPPPSNCAGVGGLVAGDRGADDGGAGDELVETGGVVDASAAAGRGRVAGDGRVFHLSRTSDVDLDTARPPGGVVGDDGLLQHEALVVGDDAAAVAAPGRADDIAADGGAQDRQEAVGEDFGAGA